MAIRTHIAQQEEGQVENSVQLRTADPSTPVSDQLWIDKTNQKIKYFDGSTVEIGGGTATVGLPEEGFQAFVSGATLVSAPNTVIQNRAQINLDLQPAFGVERVMCKSFDLIPNEFGPNGENIYEIDNKDPRVRLGGSDIVQTSSNSGTRPLLYPGNFIEVTFFGTGLNIVCTTDASSRDIRASVDGGTLSSNLFVQGSAVLNSRNTGPNQVLKIASGLSLDVHTIRMEIASTTFNLYGFEFLNEANQFGVKAGKGIIKGEDDILALDSATDYNQGVSGTKGARIVKYLEGGAIKTAVQEVDATAQYLTSADHSNEEVIKKVNWRNFTANSANDFGPSISGGPYDRAFTLDDGTTTLVGEDIQLNDNELSGAANGDRWTLTFVGTGIDLIALDAQLDRECEVFINGTSVGNITGDYSTKHRKKIASGLPYGTHTLKLVGDHPTNSAKDLIAVSDFIIYQPKKPSIPATGLEIADYNVFADFVANSTQSLDHIATGVLRKQNTREFTYEGSFTYTFDVVNSASGYRIFTSNAGDKLSYTFFGTGFEARKLGGSTNTVQVRLTDSANVTTTDFSSYTTSILGASASFNDSTGVATMSGGDGDLSISGLPLGLYTVEFEKVSGGSGMLITSIDIITPIHAVKDNYKTGSLAFDDKRKYTPIVKEDIPKYDLKKAKALLVLNGSTDEIIYSKNIAQVLAVGGGQYAIWFEKAFKNTPAVMANSNNRENQITDSIGNTNFDDFKNGCGVITRTSTGSATDTSYVAVAVFGELIDEE